MIPILIGTALLFAAIALFRLRTFERVRAYFTKRGTATPLVLCALGAVFLLLRAPSLAFLCLGAAIALGVFTSARAEAPNWRQRMGARQAMSIEEAAEILGVRVDASPTEIRKSHHRLILRNHPDQGGSIGLAARINLARDTLLRGRQ